MGSEPASFGDVLFCVVLDGFSKGFIGVSKSFIAGSKGVLH